MGVDALDSHFIHTMQRKQLISLFATAVVVVGVFTAIVITANRPKDVSRPTTQAAVTTTAVNIRQFMFMPATIRVKVGQKVTWTNHDPVSHTITADVASANAPNSMDIAEGQSYSFTFSKAGTYLYHCFPHPYMHGAVIVTE